MTDERIKTRIEDLKDQINEEAKAFREVFVNSEPGKRVLKALEEEFDRTMESMIVPGDPQATGVRMGMKVPIDFIHQMIKVGETL